jgi:hypothetical protein
MDGDKKGKPHCRLLKKLQIEEIKINLPNTKTITLIAD